MEAHLVLRNSRHLAEQDPGLVGNLLIERLIGAHIYQASKLTIVPISQATMISAFILLSLQFLPSYLVPTGF